MSQASGHQEYSAFIKDQVKVEDERKASLESRAMSVITTSGALVTLLFALAGLLTGAEGFTQPAKAGPPLRFALVFFVVAAIFALLVNIPLKYRMVEPDDLQKAIDDLWRDAPGVASQRTSATHVTVLRRAQLLNQLKGWGLILAIACEVVAIGGVARAIWAILRG